MSKRVAPSYLLLRNTGISPRLENVRNEPDDDQVRKQQTAERCGGNPILERERATKAVRLGARRLGLKVDREVIGPLDSIPPATTRPIVPVGIPPGRDTVRDVCCDCHWFPVAVGMLCLL
jgi:hypothetical protein